MGKYRLSTATIDAVQFIGGRQPFSEVTGWLIDALASKAITVGGETAEYAYANNGTFAEIVSINEWIVFLDTGRFLVMDDFEFSRLFFADPAPAQVRVVEGDEATIVGRVVGVVA